MVTNRTNYTVSIVSTIVAVVGAHTASHCRHILLEPRLAQAFTFAQQAQVVSCNADRAHIEIETHAALPEARSTDLSLVIKISRQRQASLSVRKQLPMIKCCIA